MSASNSGAVSHMKPWNLFVWFYSFAWTDCLSHKGKLDVGGLFIQLWIGDYLKVVSDAERFRLILPENHSLDFRAGILDVEKVVFSLRVVEWNHKCPQPYFI